jgi:hypothetical protein
MNTVSITRNDLCWGRVLRWGIEATSEVLRIPAGRYCLMMSKKHGTCLAKALEIQPGCYAPSQKHCYIVVEKGGK